ncbi:MAG: hypothetical protein GX465_10630, partial [Acidobacteria bacterium]|nr:hypothetical protein [Acidobacteriota bacterium]
FLSGLRSRAQDFLGTQGDGNHFAYLGRIQFTEPQRAALEAAGARVVRDPARIGAAAVEALTAA